MLQVRQTAAVFSVRNIAVVAEIHGRIVIVSPFIDAFTRLAMAMLMLMLRMKDDPLIIDDNRTSLGGWEESSSSRSR
jgi:hypothetical protein